MNYNPSNILELRSNINHKHTSESEVYIYEDHRTILNVLFLLRKKGEYKFPVDIFLFDDHDDACQPESTALTTIAKFNKKEATIEDFWTFTEFELKGLDDDWVKAGMQLNLINNVFLFNANQSGISFVEKYKTKKFGVKKIYNLGTVWSALGHRGYLYDIVKADRLGELWNDIGWVYDKQVGKFNFQPKVNFILDIDLDCFSTEVCEKRIAIPEEILVERFKRHTNPSYHDFYNSEQFVRELVSKSQFTTICFENGCCGGFRESHKIFDTIDYLFFNGEIGS